MPENALLDALVAADQEGRRRLIDRERARIAAAHVDSLSERARAAAQADPVQSLRLAGIAAELAEVTGGARARAIALRVQALALRAQGRPAEALDAFTAGTRAAEEAQDPLLAAQILIAATE